MVFSCFFSSRRRHTRCGRDWSSDVCSSDLAVFRLLSALGVLTFSGAALVAQQPGIPRQGFWGAISFGYGHSSLTSSNFDFADSAQGGGVALDMKLGGTLSPTVRLGGEVNVWTKSVGGLTEDVGNVSAAIYLYPAPRSGFFVKGGAGLASYQVSQGNTSSTTTGFGLLGGVGYDIRLGGKVSLTPVANFFWGHDGDLSPFIGIKHKIFDVGLGIQYN